MSNKRDLTQGPVSGHLVRLCLPMCLGVAAVMSVSLADTYFLGQIGTEALAAIGFVFPVLFSLVSLGIGMAAGAASVASRAIGRGDRDGVQRLATDSLLLSTLLVVVLSGGGWFLSEPLFRALGAEGVVLELVTAYMRVWFLGLPFQVLPMVAMGLIRANGDAVAPSLMMVVGAVVNIGLDPIFIFGAGPVPALGVEGAAWAALISRVLTFIAVMVLVVFRERLLTTDIPTAEAFAASAGKVAKVGIPAALSNMVNPISISIMTAFLASYGNEAVAGFGVATRIETLVTIPMLALSSAIGPVAGQNWGAGMVERTRCALRDSFRFVVLCGLALGATFFFLAEPMVRIFTDDSAVLNVSVSYLTLVGISLGGYGIVITASAAFNAIDRAVVGLLVTILRSFVLYIPLGALALMHGPPWLVFLSIAGTNVLAGAVVAWLAFRLTRVGPTAAA